MTQIPKGWELSVRDNERHRLNWKNKHPYKVKKMTPEEIEKDKQEIIARHNRLGLDENLKKELYPEYFS